MVINLKDSGKMMKNKQENIYLVADVNLKVNLKKDK